ncbi:MAG TPA: CRTAC1 family protein [Verrucomicrobiota bacterium]|nr:CRTAC1 family protein [Verrucomicrobiota bacterium]
MPCLGAEPTLTAPFTRITTGPIASEVLLSVVAAWGDYDNDGWLDLFIGNDVDDNQTDVRNSLFRNNGDGTFSKVTTGSIATDLLRGTHSAAWVDYNNDGWLDLAVADLSPERTNRLYRNNGGGEFVRVTEEEAGSFVSDLARSVAVSCADYDQDGLVDFFVANGALIENQQDFLYRNQGPGRLVRAESAFTGPALMTTQGTWADYDSDGDPDVFITHANDLGNSLFRNDGGGQFTDVSEASGLADFDDSVGSAWGDYDNDGDLDLVVINERLFGPSDTWNLLYRNEGNGAFTKITDGPITTDLGHFLAAAWVDYDNDGWLDLFVATTPSLTDPANSATNRLYRNLGSGGFAQVTAGRLVTDRAYAGGAAWGDYDNDGFLDVVVANGTIFTAQRNGLYHNDGNSNSWIKLRCIGTVSNRSAIGTQVRVKATIGGEERWQLRQIVGSEGWLTFNALDVVVGLGDATLIDTIRIEWPSGLIQELHHIAPRQTLAVTESALTLTRVDDRTLDLTWSLDGYVLQNAMNLSIPDWQPVPGVTSKNHRVTIEEQSQLFRLHRP